MPGTPKTGYMPPEKGPFRCQCCKHYQDTPKGSGCDQSEVIAELGKGKNGLAAVAPDGCCNEFEPKPKETGKRGLGHALMMVGKR